MKTEKESLCSQEVEAVRDFNLQGIYVFFVLDLFLTNM